MPDLLLSRNLVDARLLLMRGLDGRLREEVENPWVRDSADPLMNTSIKVKFLLGESGPDVGFGPTGQEESSLTTVRTLVCGTPSPVTRLHMWIKGLVKEQGRDWSSLFLSTKFLYLATSSSTTMSNLGRVRISIEFGSSEAQGFKRREQEEVNH
jgi:hypothetical protein